MKVFERDSYFDYLKPRNNITEISNITAHIRSFPAEYFKLITFWDLMNE